MKIDPRTKLLILAITSISVFLNGSITIECIFAALPFLLLLQYKEDLYVFKICSIVSCLTGNSALACSFIASECWRHYLYVCSLHSQADPLFYVRESAYFYHACQRIFSCGWKAPLAERVHDFSFYHSEVFSYDGEEWNSIKDAMALRGIPVTAAGILRHPMRTMEYVYVPMLVSASKISDEITQAAITSGIDHVQRRTCMETVRFHVMDMLVLVAYITVILLAFLANGKGWF